jgi:hypothetical protein
MKKHPANPANAPLTVAALHLNFTTLIPTASRAFGFSPAAMCHLPTLVKVKYTPTKAIRITPIIRYRVKIPLPPSRLIFVNPDIICVPFPNNPQVAKNMAIPWAKILMAVPEMI